MLGNPASWGLLLHPGLVIQRGLTKQEEKNDQNKDTLDPSAKHVVTSIKSITRPSNVSGMASLISPYSQQHESEEYDADTHESHSDFIKPSVHFDMLVDRT